jgi:hypothetical protein
MRLRRRLLNGVLFLFITLWMFLAHVQAQTAATSGIEDKKSERS